MTPSAFDLARGLPATPQQAELLALYRQLPTTERGFHAAETQPLIAAIYAESQKLKVGRDEVLGEPPVERRKKERRARLPHT